MLFTLCHYCRKCYELFATLGIVLYSLITIAYISSLTILSLFLLALQHETLLDFGIYLFALIVIASLYV